MVEFPREIDAWLIDQMEAGFRDMLICFEG